MPRADTPKQFQQSLGESNYITIPPSNNGETRKLIQKPHDYDQLSFHEKLMYTDKVLQKTSMGSPSKQQISTKLEVIPSPSQKKVVCHGHESTVVVKPSPDHVKGYHCLSMIIIWIFDIVCCLKYFESAFKDGIEATPPLKIIKHVKVGVKQPKMSSGNTSPSICRNYAGGFYATAWRLGTIHLSSR